MSIIFILGNGPSLNEFDLNLARDMGPIYGTNRTTELCHSSHILQDIYFVNDLRFLYDSLRSRSAGDTYLDSRTLRITGSECGYALPKFSGKTKIINTIGGYGFSHSLDTGLYHGYSIVNFAFQYAVSQKPHSIIFAGVDLNYSGQLARFYEAQVTQPPDPIRGKQISVFKMGLSCARDHGINIYNASRNSLLAPYMKALDWEDI